MKRFICALLLLCVMIPSVANAWNWKLAIKVTAAAAISHAVVWFGNESRDVLRQELRVAGVFSLLLLRIVFLDEPGDPLYPQDCRGSSREDDINRNIIWRHNEGWDFTRLQLRVAGG